MKITKPPVPPPPIAEASIISSIPTKIMMKAAMKIVKPHGKPAWTLSGTRMPDGIAALFEQS